MIKTGTFYAVKNSRQTKNKKFNFVHLKEFLEGSLILYRIVTFTNR